MSSEFIYKCTECYELYVDKEAYFDHLVTHHGMQIVDGKPQEQNEPGNDDDVQALSPPAKVGVRGQKLWTREETLPLIEEYRLRASKFRDPKIRNKDLWKEIAESLKLGYSWLQCEGRWKTITSAQKRVSDHNGRSGNNAVKYEFDAELTAATGDKKNIKPAHILNSQDPGSFGLEQGSSSKRPSFSRKQLLNDTSGGAVGDENQEPTSKVARRKIPKKDDLFSWLKENDKAHQELQERHHKENIDVMKELIGVLKQRGGTDN